MANLLPASVFVMSLIWKYQNLFVDQILMRYLNSQLMQGLRHNFQSGGINITASEASRNIFVVVPPHVTFWGSNSCKETGEPIGQRYPGNA